MPSNTRQQEQFYDKRWKDKSYLNSLKLRRASKILEYFFDVKKKWGNPTILDLGCGDGKLTSFMGFFGPATGVDLSGEAMKLASEKFSWNTYFQANALEVEVENNSFECIVSQEVIEHIVDQDLYLKQCYRILKQNGFLILTTPNKWVFDHMKGRNWSNQPIENIITYKECRRMVSKYFRIIKSETIIINFGKLGFFRVVNSSLMIGGSRRLGLTRMREYILSKLGFGIHTVILAQKI